MKGLVPVLLLFSLVLAFSACQGIEEESLADGPDMELGEARALIPIARQSEHGWELLKEESAYWGFFQKNYHVFDPSLLSFHKGEQRGVRLVPVENKRTDQLEVQLAVEAYDFQQEKEVFFRLELEEVDQQLFLRNINQNILHVFFCKGSGEECELRFKENGDVKACFEKGNETRCDIVHRVYGVPK